jgi:hypothetical protein
MVGQTPQLSNTDAVTPEFNIKLQTRVLPGFSPGWGYRGKPEYLLANLHVSCQHFSSKDCPTVFRVEYF